MTLARLALQAAGCSRAAAGSPNLSKDGHAVSPITGVGASVAGPTIHSIEVR